MNIEYSATRIIEAGKERIEQRYYQRAATIHRMELRELVVGPQPAVLFEPPADYQRHAIGEGFARWRNFARPALS